MDECSTSAFESARWPDCSVLNLGTSTHWLCDHDHYLSLSLSFPIYKTEKIYLC